MSATESSVKEPTAKEQRIRELAYQIWETEGCPDGQAARHWELANKLAEVEVSPQPAPAKRSTSVRKPREAAQVTAAEIIAPSPAPPPTTRKSRAAKSGAAKADAPNVANTLRDTTTTDT